MSYKIELNESAQADLTRMPAPLRYFVLRSLRRLESNPEGESRATSGLYAKGILQAMARYEIPQNVGKVKVAVFVGNKYAVWNGKQGQHEFRIVCRDRKQATEVAEKINRKDHNGQIEVLG